MINPPGAHDANMAHIQSAENGFRFLTCRVEVNLDLDVVIYLEEYLPDAGIGNHLFTVFDLVFF